MAGYQVFRTGHALAAEDEIYERYGVAREADIAAGAGLTALFLGSAIYGYWATAHCESMRENYVDPSHQLFRWRTPSRAAAGGLWVPPVAGTGGLVTPGKDSP